MKNPLPHSPKPESPNPKNPKYHVCTCTTSVLVDELGGDERHRDAQRGVDVLRQRADEEPAASLNGAAGALSEVSN